MALGDAICGYMTQDKNEQFAYNLKQYAEENMSFKLSSRGWAYQLEGMNLIDKGDFDKIANKINELRKQGLLPWNFTAEDSGRVAEYAGYGDYESLEPAEFLKDELDNIKTIENRYNVSFWNTQEYYIEVWVEKVDLVSLFKGVCCKYYVPIANTKGWPSINMRGRIARRFDEKQREGKKVKLLYFGDFDPKGMQISNRLVKLFNDISASTGYIMGDDVVERFGLNYDIIQENNLTWIDNLKSGSGKKPDLEDKLYVDWISKYGKRKVEANAIIPKPELAKNIMENAIKRYLGDDPLQQYEQTKREKQDEVEQLKEKVNLTSIINELKQEL